MEMNEMNNAMDSVAVNTPVVEQDTPVSNTGVNLKTVGLAGLAAVVVGAVAYYGYKKYQDSKSEKAESK